jgi:hypothetical protein
LKLGGLLGIDQARHHGDDVDPHHPALTVQRRQVNKLMSEPPEAFPVGSGFLNQPFGVALIDAPGPRPPRPPAANRGRPSKY